MDNINFTHQGLTIRGQIFGKGRSIIALHGWLDNSASFQPLADHLNNYTIHAIDLPGHGLSDHLPATQHYHFIDMLPLLDAYIKETSGNEPCILLGHSLGAAIASIYAGIKPENVDKLILIEAIGPLSAPSDSITDQIKHFLNNTPRHSMARTLPDLEKAIHARAIKSNMHFEASKHISERSIESVEGGYRWTHDERLQGPSLLKLTEEQVKTILNAITSPTCFIQAKDGFMYEHLKKRMHYLKKPPLHHELTGGHHLHMEQPKEVAKRIEAFLETFIN